MTSDIKGNPSRPQFDGVSAGRRRNMQANRSKDTKPELTVRRLAHALGYRFRIHLRSLPGRPDIVFTARRKVVEIRGCFWHGHGCHPLGQLPKSRTEYWVPKIAANRDRDIRNEAALREAGWQVLVFWECSVRRDPDGLRHQLSEFLGPVRTLGRKKPGAAGDLKEGSPATG
jgi:DNA mismatch endonuclease (patch repair protein)